MNKYRIPRRICSISAVSFLSVAGLVAQSETEDEEVFELSPFEVKSSDDDIGYRATNTLAGSRLSTNLADIGASITVVTKQQMEDTASTDLNDMFRYEAGTEGSSTYTPGVMSMRNDGVVDVNAGYANGANGISQTNATANTVRGLGSPDSSINFYRSIKQIPVDSYNVQSIEISRGPNSMLFGIGTPAGVVNQSRSAASLVEDATSLKMRFDDLGSKRFSLTANRVLREDKLAFFAALLKDDKEFSRKPSYDDTRRLYGTLTFKPFEASKITASIEKYDNKHSRPNTLTPRDGVSKWFEDQMPMYDASTRMITQLATGKTVGPIVRSNGSITMDEAREFIMGLPDYDPSLWNENQDQYDGTRIYGDPYSDEDSPFFVRGIGRANSRPVLQFQGGEVVNFMQPQPPRYRLGWGTDEDPTANQAIAQSNGDLRTDPITAPVYDQFWTYGNFGDDRGNLVGNYVYPGVTDRSIYDWEELNLLSMNFGTEEATTYNLEFEHKLTDELFFSAGWFRQDFSNNSSYTVSQLNAATLYVDTNLTLPDGSPNPYSGGVYLDDIDPDRFQTDVLNDQYRAILAYTPDFTVSDGWTRWLGKHQFLAYASREKETRSSIRQRMGWSYESEEASVNMIRFLPNPNDNADGTPTGFANNGRTFRRQWYLSKPNLSQSEMGQVNGPAGQYTPAEFTTDMTVYNWEAKEWQDVSYTLGYKPWAAGSSQTKIDSWNLGGSSYFWDERIVATYGIREDKASNRGTTEAAIYDTSGNLIVEELDRTEKWIDGDLNVASVLNRYRPWESVSERTSTAGIVFRPFSNWDGIEASADSGNVFSQFINSLGFTYNDSETFNPPTSFNVDFFGNELPKPGGEGKDYGIQFSLFDKKLFARISRYESSNVNEQTSIGSAGSRFRSQIDTNTFRSWANTITKINWGLDPRVDDEFNADLTPEQEERLERESEVIWGLPYDYYDELPGGVAGTRNIVAEGTEFQLTYNPTRNWTIKVTASEQETIYSNVLTEYLAWKDFRLPYLQSANAADFILPEYQAGLTFVPSNGDSTALGYVTEGGTEVNLTNYWQSYGYTSAARITDEAGNTSIEGYYNNIVTPQEAVALDLDGQVVTNQPKYRASVITNYKFTDGRFKGFSVGGSMRWIDEKSIGYYGKSSGDPDRPDGYLDLTDVSRPIYTPAQYYYDFWSAYKMPIMDGKVDMKIQLNIVNAFESGGLQTVGVNRDGSPHSFRIIEPRKFQLSLSFDM